MRTYSNMTDEKEKKIRNFVEHYQIKKSSKYQSFILTTIMGAFLSAFENTELETHHYIREFWIRNAKINRVNEQKKFVYPIYLYAILIPNSR